MTRAGDRPVVRALVLALLVLVAFGLRWHHSTQSQVANIAAGDAAQYFLYARNLREHGVYSKANADAGPVTPDDYRPPGYALMLAAVMGNDPPERWYVRLMLVQAALGAFCVLLLQRIARRVLPFAASMGVAALYAAWPHAIVMAKYMLSETIFAAALLVAFWLTLRWREAPRRGRALGAGLAWSAVHSVNPVTLPFSLLVGAIGLFAPLRRWSAAVFLAGAIAFPIAWDLRSASLPPTDEPGRIGTNLVQGTYPLYHDAARAQDHPEAAAVMARIDADIRAFDRDPAAAGAEMLERFSTEPGAYLRWYLLTKPWLFFGWDIGFGAGDIFVQTTQNSPFVTNAAWRAGHSIARELNPFLFALAVLAVVGTAVAVVRRKPVPPAIAWAALLVAIVVAEHVVLQSEARYGVPFRGFEFLLAGYAIVQGIAWLGARRPAETRTPAVLHGRRPQAIVALLMLVSAHLYFFAARDTAVVEPIRSDAREYFIAAVNLQNHGVYSTEATEPGVVPRPNAVRSPGYPFLLRGLLPFGGDSVGSFLSRATLLQAAIGVLLVPLGFLLARAVFGTAPALAVAAALAITPHLVVFSTYLLSELPFALAVTLALLMLVLGLRGGRSRALLFAAGLLVGIAALIRPTVQYLPFVLAAFLLLQRTLPDRKALAALLVVGALVPIGAWTVRNIVSIGRATDSTIMIGTIHHGSYRGLMYEDRPESYGFPYRFDPGAERISSSWSRVVGHVGSEFRDRPLRMFAWYFLEKPFYLVGWQPGQGSGDIFQYEVARSPYLERPEFLATRALMRALHWPLMLLGYLGAIVAWFPVTRRVLGDTGAMLARSLSVVLAYVVAIHIVGAPFARYSVPFRPLQYVLAMLPIACFWRSRITATESS